MAGDRYSRERGEKAVSITSIILHKHYCENDVEAVIGYFDEPFMFRIGAGESRRYLPHFPRYGSTLQPV